MQTKTCTKCNVEKPLTEFYKKKTGKYGVDSQCKECIGELRREYNRRPEVRERNLEYRRRPEVRERNLESQREYYQRPEVKKRKREYKREYYQRPEIKERRREYLQRPEVKERNHEYRQRPEVKERRRESQREYYQRPEVKKRKSEYYKAREELGIPPTRRGGKIANKHATHSGAWSDAEIKFLMSSDLPLADIALELGRTYNSVYLKRTRLRKQFSANRRASLSRS